MRITHSRRWTLPDRSASARLLRPHPVISWISECDWHVDRWVDVSRQLLMNELHGVWKRVAGLALSAYLTPSVWCTTCWKIVLSDFNYRRNLLAIDFLSVCPSVSRRYCVKTNERTRWCRLHWRLAQCIYNLRYKVHQHIRKGQPLTSAVNETGVCDFWPTNRRCQSINHPVTQWRWVL